MFELTKQERKVLLALALICLMGVSLDYAFEVNPSLANMVNVIERHKSSQQIDINRASYAQLIRVPYLGPLGAGRVLLYRRRLGGLDSIKDLLAIQGIDKERLRIISKHLKVDHENAPAPF